MKIEIPDELIPKGYRLTGEWRRSNDADKGEFVLTCSGAVKSAADVGDLYYPILRKIRQWRLVETGEERIPELGEFYINGMGAPEQFDDDDWQPGRKRRILRCLEEEK